MFLRMDARSQKPSVAMFAEGKAGVSEHCSSLQEQVRQRLSLVKQGEFSMLAVLCSCGWGKIGIIEDCAVPSDGCQEVMIRVSWVCCTV